MTHTHQYDCIVCGAHFDSSEAVAAHNEEAHLRNATGMERPRTTTSDADQRPTPETEHDRNPRQGFIDPRNDDASST